jgi:hypothetical protein
MQPSVGQQKVQKEISNRRLKSFTWKGAGRNPNPHPVVE